MSTYVLIHGAWHGAWCWYKLVPLLEKQGHKVIAPDLPGHGDDQTAIPDISLSAYTDLVCQILDAQSEPVILLGHSMAGIVITQVAEYRPEKIKCLVYLSAYLPRHKESLHLIAENAANSLPEYMILSDDGSYSTVRKSVIKQAFYEDCSAEDIALAMSQLVPQATTPLISPVRISAEKFGLVRRIYISCLRDRTISLALQQKMLAASPCEKVLSVDSSHSPFFSAPEQLAGHLLSL